MKPTARTRGAGGRIWAALAASGLLVGAAWVVLCAEGEQGGLAWEQLRAQYDYDAAQPLNARAEVTARGARVVEERIEFDSPKGGRVAGLLLRPIGVEKPPVVLFLHGLGGKKEDSRLMAPLLGSRGYAVFGLDAALHGERKVPEEDIMSPRGRVMYDGFIQTVVDYRRAMDYLESRDDVDASRIGLIGASMGAIMGSIVAAVDKRVDAALLVVGGGDWLGIVQTSTHPAAERLRKALDGAQLQEVIERIDPVNYVGHISPRPVWMVNGKQDQIIPARCAEALHNAAEEPKRVIWYDGGHIPDVKLIVKVVNDWIDECMENLGGGHGGEEAAKQEAGVE